MSTKNTIVLALAAVLLLSLPLAFLAGRWTAPPQYLPGTTKVIVSHDTPTICVKEVPVGHATALLPVVSPNADKADTPDSTAAVVRDSALVSIPIVQRTFEGEYYRAVVQGYDPQLVGIDIFLPQPEPEKRKPRLGWGLGLQLGYGLTPAGFQPYIGIGGSWGIEF
jgi:hypothetical protein